MGWVAELDTSKEGIWGQKLFQNRETENGKKKLHKKISEGKVEGRKTNVKHSPQLKIYMFLQKERTQGVLK